MTSLNEKTCLMICGEEGFSRRTYFDSGQVNTWSFGITNASGFDVRKYIHQAATQDECVKAYLEVLNGYFREVCKALGDGVSLEVLTGATSFHWNTGAINRASWVRLWKAKEFEAAEKHFLEWDQPASILKRREREANLIFHGEWNIQPCTEWTRLRPNRHIDWKSGRHVNILPSIKKALAQ